MILTTTRLKGCTIVPLTKGFVIGYNRSLNMVFVTTVDLKGPYTHVEVCRRGYTMKEFFTRRDELMISFNFLLN